MCSWLLGSAWLSNATDHLESVFVGRSRDQLACATRERLKGCVFHQSGAHKRCFAFMVQSQSDRNTADQRSTVVRTIHERTVEHGQLY